MVEGERAAEALAIGATVHDERAGHGKRLGYHAVVYPDPGGIKLEAVFEPQRRVAATNDGSSAAMVGHHAGEQSSARALSTKH